MNKTKIILTILCICLMLSIAVAQDNVIQLKLTKALVIAGPQNSHPSGLTMWNDTLFCVSDKHDDIIFSIEILDDEALMIPYLTFKLPQSPNLKKIDLEGITSDDKGVFYLVSESAFRILKVSHNGDEVQWITQSLEPYGQEKGLFQVKNANLEGITYIKPDSFIVCAERQGRGILELNTSQIPCNVRAYNLDTTRFFIKNDIKPDFSALFYDNETLFVLERNTFTVCQLIKYEQNYIEGEAWSYESVETDEKYQYQDMKYGRGEGLCMDENNIFIILDNNGDFRKCDSDDNRPLLFIFERPK